MTALNASLLIYNRYNSFAALLKLALTLINVAFYVEYNSDRST